MRTTILALLLLAIIVCVSAADKNLFNRWRDGVQKKMHNIYDKKLQRKQAEVESDKKIKIDDIFNWVGKGKQVYDIIKSFADTDSEILRLPTRSTCQCIRAPCHCSLTEEESDIKIGKLLGKIGKGAVKIGKAYVGQKYGINLSDEEIASDIKIGKLLGKIGKGALKVGKAYVGQKYGIQLADTESDIKIGKLLGKIDKGALKIGKIYANAHGIPLSDSSAFAGLDAASWAKNQAGKGYSQSNRLGPGSFDCSGLVKQAWAQAGKTVPNTTRGYPTSGMQTVSPSQMRPGDILYRPGHVGMYTGNNKVVNAENPRSGVQVRDLGWYQKNMGFTKVYRP